MPFVPIHSPFGGTDSFRRKKRGDMTRRRGYDHERTMKDPWLPGINLSYFFAIKNEVKSNAFD